MIRLATNLWALCREGTLTMFVRPLLKHRNRRRIAAQIERALAERRIARKYRSEAAKAGHSTYWRRAGAQCRRMYGGA